MEFSYSDNEAAIFAIVSAVQKTPGFLKVTRFFAVSGGQWNLGTGELGKDEKENMGTGQVSGEYFGVWPWNWRDFTI